MLNINDSTPGIIAKKQQQGASKSKRPAGACNCSVMITQKLQNVAQIMFIPPADNVRADENSADEDAPGESSRIATLSKLSQLSGTTHYTVRIDLQGMAMTKLLCRPGNKE